MKKLLYFTSPWCKACINLEPYLDEIKKKVSLIRIDVSKHPVLSAELGVTSLPTMILLNDANEVMRCAGASDQIVADLFRAVAEENQPFRVPDAPSDIGTQ